MLQEFDIDTERLPLGTLSKDQVQRGYDVLERLRSALDGSGDSLERLSSEFYQVPVSTLPFQPLACCICGLLGSVKLGVHAGKQHCSSCYDRMQLPICIQHILCAGTNEPGEHAC